MANSSTAYGTYEFDFKDVKASNEDRLAWLKMLGVLLYDQAAYDTYFPSLSGISVDDVSESVSLDFEGTGRWTYRSNIDWFQSFDKLKELMLSMDGLRIDIFYKEYEPGGNFVSKGNYVVRVKNKEVFVDDTDIEEDKLNEKNFVEWGFGSAAEYDELFEYG